MRFDFPRLNGAGTECASLLLSLRCSQIRLSSGVRRACLLSSADFTHVLFIFHRFQHFSGESTPTKMYFIYYFSFALAAAAAAAKPA